MAKASKIAWGIDVGNCTLKALKLGHGPEGVEILDFAVIEHEKILSQPEIEPEQRSELIADALVAFLSEHDVKGAAVMVSVPGQNSFARFIKLPPVESKRIPDLVRFEAIQQIPFDINDVEWDWQKFEVKESPEVEVGIFAIKKDLVAGALEPFTQTGCMVTGVQMAPIALYNFLRFDQKRIAESGGKEAVIALDIGADNTNLVIADGVRVWQRNIPIGGNHFTAAVQKAFKLSFVKAEAIKRSANTSKYARQIFQAMRSVFADLAAEVQRSLGFYSSSNRNVQFRQVLALGNAMKLPGLVKFLQQSLSLPVKRMDHFSSAKLGSGVSAAKFSECLPSMGVVYGLALQGLGEGAIESDLLPGNLARQSQLKRKRGWFAASVGVVLCGALLFLAQSYSQKGDIESSATQGSLNTIQRMSGLVQSRSQELSKFKSDIQGVETTFSKYMKYYGDRTVLARLLQQIRQSLPHEGSATDAVQQQVYAGYREGNREAVMSVPRDVREQIFLTGVKLVYTKNLDEDMMNAAGPWISGSASRTSGMTSTMSSGGFDNRGVTNRPVTGGLPGAGGGSSSPSGFVVVLEGYTPHKDNLAFLFPPDVGLDRSKWGFFNRLQYLGKTDKQILDDRKGVKESVGVGSPAGMVPGMPGRPAAPGMPSRPAAPGMPSRGPAAGAPGAPSANEEPAGESSDISAELSKEVPATAEQAAANQAASGLPFETYVDSSKPLRYSFDTTESGWVTSGQSSQSQYAQPAGIGIEKEIRDTRVGASSLSSSFPDISGSGGISSSGMSDMIELIDPFTFETISTTMKKDASGRILYGPDGNPMLERHDYWFRLKFKVKLKSASEEK